MSAISYELEQELEQELAHEAYPVEAHVAAHEQEADHEAFFNSLAAMGERSGHSQALRKIALAAAKAALHTQPPPPPGIEGEGAHSALAELEYETSVKARTPGQIDAMLEHLGHSAAEAANEQEAAEQMAHAVPLATKLAKAHVAHAVGPHAAHAAPKAIHRVAPALTRGVANATRTVFRSPTARPLLHAMPRIARHTVTQLARKAAHGHPITPRVALRTLAKNTLRTLSNPHALVHSYRRSLHADRRHHHRMRPLVGATPHHHLAHGVPWHYRRYNLGAPIPHAGAPIHHPAAHHPSSPHYRRWYRYGTALPGGTTYSTPVHATHPAHAIGHAPVPVPAGMVPVGVTVSYAYPKH